MHVHRQSFDCMNFHNLVVLCERRLARDSSVVWVGQVGETYCYNLLWCLKGNSLCTCLRGEVRAQDQLHSSPPGEGLVSCSKKQQQGRYMGRVGLSLSLAEACAPWYTLQSQNPCGLNSRGLGINTVKTMMSLLKLSTWFSFSEKVVHGTVLLLPVNTG